ncbi:hypothetical protein QRD43_21995 [Pelomonas sp. APW6]|uniref:DedA family protein n=1 Tax=Roseateles subflavus TaxID=3053353 RepID=A0ABT7LP40_9BURK|nr:hypothetical protein [Pelomonas sp. APW6]MDL5034593.1 hypothetical protein [Pelomonas sp. APW6]
MPELSLLLLAGGVFVLNAMPAFAPPTWMLLAFYALQQPGTAPLAIAGVAACAATGGRLLLARSAQRISDSRWMRPSMRENMLAVARAIDGHQRASTLAFLAFAISPLPSNVLFLAYGLARAPLRLLAWPFFAGRFVSYTLAVIGGSYAGRQLQLQFSGLASGIYFVVSQCLLLLGVWLFTRVNWRQALSSRWLRWWH